MEKKVRFETLAELQETYPVGSVFHREEREITETRYFYNQKDLNHLKRLYHFVEPIDDNTCFCRRTEYITKVVEGYLYDGEFWYPVRDSFDGWYAYDEFDCMTMEETREYFKQKTKEIIRND